MSEPELQIVQVEFRPGVDAGKVYPISCKPSRPERCSKCSRTSSPTWRKSSNGARLCNPCGLREGRVRKMLSGKIERCKHIIASQRDILNDPAGEPLDIGYDQGENILDLSVVSPTHPIPFDFSGDCSSIETAAFFDPAKVVTSDRMPQLCSLDFLASPQLEVEVQRRPREFSRTELESDAWLDLYKSDSFVDNLTTCNRDPDHCRCLQCLWQLFTVTDVSISNNIVSEVPLWLSQFFGRTAEVHFQALQKNSSVYVAMESFLYEQAGQTRELTAYAVLREEYDAALSPSMSFPWFSHSQAAHHDLVFNCIDLEVPSNVNSLPQMYEWSDGQALVDHITSTRAMSAVWDLTRLPIGSHHAGSHTFRYLQRTFHTFRSNVGLKTMPSIISGSRNHDFRGVHPMIMLLKHAGSNAREEYFKSIEPFLHDACIQSCQEWFIACLEEAVTRQNTGAQLQFLLANKEYMCSTMDMYQDYFQNIQVNNVPQICSPHVPLSFHTLVSSAKKALDALFSPADVLHYIHSKTPLLTQDQLDNAKIIGYVQYKLCFSCHLLNEEKEARDNGIMWKRFAHERAKLLEQSKARLIWNYLPLHVSQKASAKLDCAIASHRLNSLILDTWQ